MTLHQWPKLILGVNNFLVYPGKIPSSYWVKSPSDMTSIEFHHRDFGSESKENKAVERTENHQKLTYLIRRAIKTMPTTAFTFHILFGLTSFTWKTAYGFWWFGMLQFELDLCEQIRKRIIQFSSLCIWFFERLFDFKGIHFFSLG